MRFIIYQKEFFQGERTSYLRTPLHVTEDEAVARAKQKEFFEGEVERYRSIYWFIEMKMKEGTLIVKAPEHDRFSAVAILDELRPETHWPLEEIGL